MNVFKMRYRKIFPRNMKDMDSASIPNWSRSGCFVKITARLQT